MVTFTFNYQTLISLFLNPGGGGGGGGGDMHQGAILKCRKKKRLTRPTVCVTAGGLVDWGGVGGCLSIDHMTEGRAGGHLTIYTIGG